MRATDDRRDRGAAFAAHAGRLLRGIDLACGWAYVAGTVAFGAWLAWLAVTVSAWLWLMAVPMIVTGALLGAGLWRRPHLGLHLDWPFSARPRPRARISPAREPHRPHRDHRGNDAAQHRRLRRGTRV